MGVREHTRERLAYRQPTANIGRPKQYGMHVEKNSVVVGRVRGGGGVGEV